MIYNWNTAPYIKQEERFTRQDIIGENEHNKTKKKKKSDINQDLKPRKSYNDQLLCFSAERNKEYRVALGFGLHYILGYIYHYEKFGVSKTTFPP